MPFYSLSSLTCPCSSSMFTHITVERKVEVRMARPSGYEPSSLPKKQVPLRLIAVTKPCRVLKICSLSAGLP